MHRFYAPVLGAFTFLLLLANTIFWCLPIYFLMVLKLLPFPDLRKYCYLWMLRLGMGWLDGVEMFLHRTRSISWEIASLPELRRDGWYLVICNHQSWVDIPVLEHLLHRRIPFLKFFTKKQLLHMPLIGTAIKGLDFPLVERHSREEVARRPELKGRDFASARAACERYRDHPVSIVIFPEGTRFTPAKHDRQESPFNHLLIPKAGGIGAVAGALGDRLHGVLDVTIVYPQGRPSFWDYLTGRCSRVMVDVRCRPVPPEWATGDYQGDSQFRAELQAWLGEVWREKEERMEAVKGDPTRLSQ